MNKTDHEAKLDAEKKLASAKKAEVYTRARADKKVKEAEAMDALVAAGHTPQFDGDGRCVISLSKAFGDVACSGDWSAGEGAPLCVQLFVTSSEAVFFF